MHRGSFDGDNPTARLHLLWLETTGTARLARPLHSLGLKENCQVTAPKDRRQRHRTAGQAGRDSEGAKDGSVVSSDEASSKDVSFSLRVTGLPL